MKITESFESDLSREQVTAIVKLTNGIWPDETLSEERMVERFIDNAISNPGFVKCFVIWNAGNAIAHAKTFVRTITSDERQMSVLALAGVCTSPKFRGQGLGVQVVMRAFSQLGNLKDNVDVSLFQTGVPAFYEKLGGRLVSNEFRNSLNLANPDKNPWWDTHVMIHPAEFDWPETAIDLTGPGY